jgi:arabinofuranosyltransferase
MLNQPGALPRLNRPPALATTVSAVLLMLAAWLIWRNAWVTDDAAITLRTVLNLLTGHGARFNIDERVQAYTHPLWFILVTAGTLITGNAFLTAAILGAALSMLTLLWLMRLAIKPWQGLLAVAALLCSKAFMDFSTSGLENPLSHLLLVAAASTLIAAHDDLAEAGVRLRAVRRFFLCAGLLYLSRPDLTLLLAPTALQLLLMPARQLPLQWRARWRALAWAAVPVLAWSAFSLFYYGYPFPNTAYAKLGMGIPRAELLAQGIHYLQNTLAKDRLTLAVAALALLLAPLVRTWGWAWGSGMALYVVYVTSIGGDFMAGRFFTAPMLAGAIMLARVRLHPAWLAALTLGVAALGWPSALQTTRCAITNETKAFKKTYKHSIADEKSFYFDIAAVARISPQGLTLFKPSRWRVGTRDTMVICGVLGYISIVRGPGTHMIDTCALADPLLARLPMTPDPDWRIGHFVRSLPAGYQESIVQDANLLTDPALHKRYERIRRITRAPLFDRQRLKDIAVENLGFLQKE